ncbi:MAG: hypothetical protein Q4G70_06305 [Pseudomonadota bacterium]|nr:hypothetical protein [Pseudomonadota bacterium]
MAVPRFVKWLGLTLAVLGLGLALAVLWSDRPDRSQDRFAGKSAECIVAFKRAKADYCSAMTEAESHPPGPWASSAERQAAQLPDGVPTRKEVVDLLWIGRELAFQCHIPMAELLDCPAS